MLNPTLEHSAARIDRFAMSRFHFMLLAIAAASLLIDMLDGLAVTFVLSDPRTIWSVDVATIGIVSADGFGGYLVGAASCGFPRTGWDARKPSYSP